MGASLSSPQYEEKISYENNTDDIVKLADASFNNDNIIDTLNLSDLHPQLKSPMPLIGGNSEDDISLYNYSQQRVVKSKNRYNNYDLFSVINELELKKNLAGGNLALKEDGKHEEESLQSSSSNQGMDAIKNIILREIDNYQKNNPNQNLNGGGDCGCDGNATILEGGKNKKEDGNYNKD